MSCEHLDSASLVYTEEFRFPCYLSPSRVTARDPPYKMKQGLSSPIIPSRINQSYGDPRDPCTLSLYPPPCFPFFFFFFPAIFKQGQMQLRLLVFNLQCSKGYP